MDGPYCLMCRAGASPLVCVCLLEQSSSTSLRCGVVCCCVQACRPPLLLLALLLLLAGLKQAPCAV